MSEDKVYKDGDAVWVKLGNSWWPGEVIGDEKRLPDDVHQLKKRPYCVVKFFQEDAYEYPKSEKQIYPFQCSKKNEFIKKGLALYNAKKAFMEKFPDDVKHAENLTKPATTTRIINDRPGGLVKEMWGQGFTRRSTDYYENCRTGACGSGGLDTQNHGTSRRDSVTTILNITPNRSSVSSTAHTKFSSSDTPARTLSTSSSASITPNTAASSQYRCNLCEFTTMRQNVLIMHRKSHSSSGKGPTKSLVASTQPSTALTSSSMSEERLSISTKIIAENEITTSTSTPLTTKGIVKISTVEKKIDEGKVAESKAKELLLTTRTRKRGSATPSPKTVASKRTLRNLRAAQTSTPTEVEQTAAQPTLSPTDDDTTANRSHRTGVVSPTDSKNSETIRQRLLADWSDEEKEEHHEDVVPSTSKKNKSLNSLQLPSMTNVESASTKRRSPTIVSMKTLEGAGQTLVVAAATQSNASQEANTKSTPRIRNIPKKDRLRDFGNSVSALDEQAKGDEIVADATTTAIATSTIEEPTGKLTVLSTITTATTTTETESVPCTTNVSTATLSCFDFQEDEEEPETDVLKSIANYKKKYFSPDKDKAVQSTTSAINENVQANKFCATEKRDKELSAEIDSLLEQTTAVTPSFREDTVVPVSVKGLPIKERGKRIFKSRNRARIDNDDGGTIVEVVKKPIEALETNTNAVVEEVKQETNVPVSVSPSLSERITRAAGKRTRGKVDTRDVKTTTSPVNGNAEKNKPTENIPVETTSTTEPVQSVAELIYVSQRSKRKPYNHRIMRQLIEDEETSIPFIRHSPVEIYSCDSSMDNGTHVIRGRRSKTTTPNPLTAVREENVNGSSRTSSRNMNAAPLTPTDETSSLGVSDAGAEFGSPASSLDEERLLTPIQDVDNQNDNKFKPINENKGYEGLSTDDDNHDMEEEDEVEDTAENVEEDEEIESPPHEALSGNELEDHEIKEGTKRLKSPKKKPNSKEPEPEQETVAASIEVNKSIVMRKSCTGTPQPSADDSPKRLTRGALQQQDKESSEEVQEVEIESERSTPTRTRSIRGSPANVALKHKSTKHRSTPTRISSRHAAITKPASDTLTIPSKSPSEELWPVEQALDENVPAVENVPSPNRANVGSPEVNVSPDSTKHTIQQRKSKAARKSKTPTVEVESEKLPMETDLHDQHMQQTSQRKRSCDTPKDDDLDIKILAATTRRSCKEEEHVEIEVNKTPERKSPVSGDKKVVYTQKSPQDDDLVTKPSPVTPRRSCEQEEHEIKDNKTLQNKSPVSGGKKVLDTPKSDSSVEVELEYAIPKKSVDQQVEYKRKAATVEDVKISSKRDSPLTLDKNSSNMDSTQNAGENSSPTPTRKFTRWDSPHSSDKKKSSVDSLLSFDKKSPQTLIRYDSSQHTSGKISSGADSPQSLVKKPSRWDSPLHTERKKNVEHSKLSTKSVDEQNMVTTQHVTLKSTTGENSKLHSSDSPFTTKVDGNETTNVADLRYSSLLAESSTTEPRSTVENVKIPKTSQTTSTFSVITSPTVEKVRINVDVANPLSTQIANILAASGNSIHNQQQLRNKSPKSNTSSPLKRKHSLEEPNVIGSSAADGDAVVAHVQSLCPQVKITRKERIITPEMESIISPPKKLTTSQNTASHYDISQMPIVMSNEQISAPKKSPRASVSNLWQTDLLQPPTTMTAMATTTSTTFIPASGDNQALLQHESNIQKYVSPGASPPQQTKILSSSGERNLSTTSGSCLSLTPRSSLSPSPQKSPAGSTGGRKQAGNTVTLPSSITVKHHQHKFAEALALADSAIAPITKATKRRNSQTTPSSTANNGNGNVNRRLNSAPSLDVRSTPPAKIQKITAGVEQINTIPAKAVMDSGTVGKTWSQSHRQAQKQTKTDLPNEIVVEPEDEITAIPVTSPSPTKITNTEENQNVTEVELNNTAKITAVPIQPIPGYAETFLLCMLVDNMYKPINNIPHYLNTDLNQLVPVPPEAYEGMLPELAVDQPPAASADIETVTESSTQSGRMSDQQQRHEMNASNQQQQQHMRHSASDKIESHMGIREHGAKSSICSDSNTSDETGLKHGETAFAESTSSAVDPDSSDGAVESVTDNGIVLNLENQQIILDSATFEQLLANPDANTQLVTDDGTEFVLTREVLTALKAQHDGQNVELLAIPTEQQQLQDHLIVAEDISEAGSSADLLSVALANSEFYRNDVLQIETTLGGGAGAAGLQLLASDGSIVFQAPPLPQAHLTPPITAHTSETNAVLNQTPIMSTLEKPSTALIGVKGGFESANAAVVSAIECDIPGMRLNLDDSLAVIGVSTQSSTVPTSLELPITITNPAIAPKVTMAQSAHAADLVQFQPHRSVATASVAATAAAVVTHIFDDPIEGIN